jgi:hypothetical protein
MKIGTSREFLSNFADRIVRDFFRPLLYRLSYLGALWRKSAKRGSHHVGFDASDIAYTGGSYTT